MKALSRLNKVVYVINTIVVVLTIIAYVFPFLAPNLFPFLSVLTLILPFFLIVNAVFFSYWFLQLKRQMIVSGLILILGITFINKFYKFSSLDLPAEESDMVVMSYNVRLFNLFQWIPGEGVEAQIKNFINEINPDILCVQEYSENAEVDLRVYKYRTLFMQGNKIKSGQAIFSKYPILNEGQIAFESSHNMLIYADIRKGQDTLRIYNMHLESIKISPDVNDIERNVDSINKKKSTLVLNRISNAFKKQQLQAEKLMQHKSTCSYPMLICGDMNNSAFSYVYRSIKGDLNDCFEEAGKGFGKTYNFKYYPARIDYIFADRSFKVKEFRTYPEFKNSDHFPIVTRIQFERD